jgi:hypothetical protein
MLVMSGFRSWSSLSGALGWNWFYRAEPANLEAIGERASNRGGAGKDNLRGLAVSALKSQSANADLRNWAERYLCGLTDATPAKFMEHRRAQA